MQQQRQQQQQHKDGARRRSAAAVLRMDSELSPPDLTTTRGGLSNHERWRLPRWKHNDNVAASLSHQCTSETRQRSPDFPPPRLDTHRTEWRQEQLLSLRQPWSRNQQCPRFAELLKCTNSSNSDDDNLVFVPFWDWQVSVLQKRLHNLQLLPVRSRGGRDMSYKESDDHTVRMYTLQLRSDEYRLIRLTLMDAGHQAHVFTSVMYPEPSRGVGGQDDGRGGGGGDGCLPLFGCDMMQFGPPSNKRMLCVIDLQPIHEMNRHYQEQQVEYERLLQPIRDQYPSLQQGMTKKFYDADRFSKQMLLGRATTVSTPTSPKQGSESTLAAGDATGNSGKDDVALLLNDLFPAFQGYLDVHLDMVQRQEQRMEFAETPSETAEATTKASAAAILERQRLYDEYAASHDPAHAMFSKHFGKEWAEEYIHDVLFPLSRCR